MKKISFALVLLTSTLGYAAPVMHLPPPSTRPAFTDGRLVIEGFFGGIQGSIGAKNPAMLSVLQNSNLFVGTILQKNYEGSLRTSLRTALEEGT